MDGDRSYLNILDNRHNEIHESADIFNALETSLSFYESFIPDFFSSNGEASGIREMYSKIREGMLHTEKTINAVDVNCGSHKYDEYIEGMKSFINDLKNSDVMIGSEDLANYKEKLGIAKENDPKFIASLFGGSQNSLQEMTLSEATANIEFLIDFIPKIKSIKTECAEIQESTKDCNELVKESVEMLFESIDNYCYSTLRNIITTYYDINESLNSNETKTVKYYRFKLF